MNTKIIVQRADVFVADLKPSYDLCLKGEHPIVILSCPPACSKSPLLSIVPITSKLKLDIPAHVKIGEAEGLKVESTVLCEQITTINRDSLLYKVGYCSRSKMQEIMIAVNYQLGNAHMITNLEEQRINSMVASIKEIIRFEDKHNIQDDEIIETINMQLAQFKAYCNSLCLNYKEFIGK